jgi:NADH-quinone oxidoreductase subunit M
MAWLDSHLLTAVVFFPAAWAALTWIFPRSIYHHLAVLGSLIGFGLILGVYHRFDPALADFQMMERVDWIPAFGISYQLGIDGISLVLLMLTGFLAPIVILGSYHYIETKTKEYYLFVMLLQTGMLGAFVALDVFLFYVFWEVMLVPMYFLIGVWGGKDRIYAAMKFFLYTVAGSLLMLVAIFFLAHQHHAQFGTYSTALMDLYRVKLSGGGIGSIQGILFLAFALAFAIKVPLFPLHTWLPDAHVQAPTGGSVILAGVLLKLGGYGFLRFAFPLFPDAVFHWQIPFLILGAIAIVYGAWVATIQPDVKKLVAYSSVSHMGYVMIGLFSLNPIGLTGSVYQMLNHGISTGALFLLVGMLYERRHTREISEFGGISSVMPLFAVAFMIVTFSSVALPGTNGFVGEFLILLGTWKAQPVIAVVSALGVVFGAVYMLWMFQRVMFGKVKNPKNEGLSDLSLREAVVLLPLLGTIVWMGVAPNFFFRLTDGSVNRLLARVNAEKIQVALVEGRHQ